MVPICRDTGSVIAFGGRQMDADRVAEVPELARNADLLEEPDAVRPAPDEGADSEGRFAVLVEGYFDFAQVFQSRRRPRSPRAARR
jgi:DNA primase